jgi:acyl-CoA thioesterase I
VGSHRRCAEYLTEHFGCEAGATHTEQHDVGEPVAPHRLGARAQTGKLRCYDVKDGQPSKPIGDLFLNRGVRGPDVELFLPECVGEADLFQARVCAIDGVGQGAGIDREGAHARTGIEIGDQEGMSSSYNIMREQVMTRIVPLSIGLLALLCVSCTQPDVPAVEARRAVDPAPAARPSPAAHPNPTRPRIVFLGDSLTAGYGLAKEQSVPSLLQARLRAGGYPYEVVNAGVSGDTSAGGLSRLDWSLEGDVKVLVIELGANDGLRGLPVGNLKRNLGEVITRARSRGIAVVLTGMEAPPNFGEAYTSEFREVYRDLAKSFDVTFMPFYLDGVAGNPSLNIADGMHPNAEGSRIIERAVWQTLEPLLDTLGAGRSSTK